MDDTNAIDRARSKALHIALGELFRRYDPAASLDELEKYHWDATDKNVREAALRWRASALVNAAQGNNISAFNIARGTGVPQEELDALRALLYG